MVGNSRVYCSGGCGSNVPAPWVYGLGTVGLSSRKCGVIVPRSWVFCPEAWVNCSRAQREKRAPPVSPPYLRAYSPG